MQQGEQYSDEVGKVCGGTGRVQGGRGQSKTKQDGGGKYDISNEKPSTAKGFYHCGKIGHIRHLPPIPHQEADIRALSTD